MKKVRLDQILVDKGLARDRKEASALVLSGAVLVDEQRVDKPGSLLSLERTVRVKQRRGKYASRGGLKLEAALDHFRIEVNDKICFDLGSSTGGFVDCLLARGARLVYAFDVGLGLLDWRLRNDKRVVVREGVNVRYLTPNMTDHVPDLVTIDLSFISLSKVLPAVRRMGPQDILAMAKPQFEAQRGEVEKGGVIRDETLRLRILDQFSSYLKAEGWSILGKIDSPVPGKKGNRECFFWISPG
jgi:23S rRNA (cytidine1920-2'-O)/16S rRNA (cytidine1409-2'-O)-methyltransferase